MPDFKSLLAAKRAEEEAKKGTQSEENTPDYQTTEPSKEGQQQQPVQGQKLPPQEKRSYGNEQEKQADIGGRVQAARSPIGNRLQEQPVATQGMQGADVTGRSWASEAGTSFMRGLGNQVIGGFGDIAQVIGSGLPGVDMFEGNILSRFLQEKGKSIGNANQVYMPEELMNPEFSIKTLTNPEFWSKHGAEYIPQLAEFIFLSKGAGSLVKKGAQMGAKKALKGGLVKNATGTLKNSAKKLASGADEIMEISGSGKGLGRFITDTGTLTKGAALGIENIGAGAAGNIVTGLMNSAEAYNSRKELIDGNGNPLFTKDELSDIASETFQNNLMYMGVDILSWGMTYGGAGKILKQSSLMKKGSAAFDKMTNLKNISKAFTAKTSPTLRKVAAAAGKGVQEGFEETFQETYETWAAMMAESDVMGTPPKYDSFMDFYNSEENEGTKTIAFALGLLGGGVAGLTKTINADAERSRQLYDRTENLKTIFDNSDEEGNKMQKFHMRETVSDMVLQGKTDLFESYVEGLVKEGVATEEEILQMEEMIDDYQILDNQADQLNIRGKYALFQAHSSENFFQEAVEDEKNKLEDVISIIEESNLTDEQKAEQIEQRTAQTDTIIKGLTYGIAQAQANKANLILGKAIENVIEPVVVKDPKTGKNIVATGMKKPNYKYYVSDKNEDILKPNNKKEVLKANAEYDGSEVVKEGVTKLSSLGKKARSLFENLFNKNSENAGKSTDTESGTSTTEETDDERENGEGVPPSSPSGEGPTGNDQNDGAGTSSVQGEENGNGTEEDSESVNDINDDVQDAELQELSKLQEEADALGKEPKAESPKQKLNRRKRAEEVGKRLSELTKKVTSKVSEKLPKGLDKDLYDKVLGKLTGKKPLSKKEQAVYDKFESTFDKAVEKGKNVGRKFQDFVNNQNTDIKGIAKEQADKAKKAADNIADGIKRYSKKKGPFKPSTGKESRGDENVQETSPEFVEDISPNEETQVLGDTLGRIRYAPSDLDKMVAINQRLNFMFPKPDSRVNAYILDNLTKAIGIRGSGFAVASTIFVNSDKWDQGEVYMHEMAHIFYSFAKNRPETLGVMEKVMANKELIKKLEGSPENGGYADYVLYSFGEDADGRTQIGSFNGVPTEADLEKFNATKLPLEQQDAILEEAFVATLQGPLSKKYNKFFGLSDEAKRIESTRKWWKMIDTQAKSDPEYLEESNQLLRKLNNNEDLDVDNMRDYIVMEFLKEVPRLETREIGFESRTSDFNNDAAERKAVIRKRLETQNNTYDPREVRELLKQKESTVDQVLDEITDNREDSDNTLSMAEKSFATRTAQASKLINNFIKEYNKAVRLRKTIWGRKGPLFDKKEFRYKIFQLAANSDNAISFIDAIENSPQPDIQAFAKFMDLRFPMNKDTLLNSTWTLYSNQRMVNAVKSVMSVEGNNVKHEIQESLSKREQNQVQTMLDNMAKARRHVQKNTGHLLGGQWRDFETIIGKIENGTASEQDYIEAYRFMAPPGTKMMDILENGFINVKGTYYSPVTVLKSFVDSKRHLGTPDKNNIRRIYPYNFKPIADALMATNREFTQDSVVENAKGNMVPVRIMNNHMTKELDQMAASLRPTDKGNVMSKEDFIKRYSHITSSKGYRKPVPNQFLESFYDSVMSGTKPDLVYYTGINDLTSNNANSFEESTSYEQSFEDFMMYASEPNKKTYLANVGVFGDSPRKYYMPTKRLNMDNSINDAAYNIYRNISGDNISRRQFELAYKQEQKTERDFFESNAKELSKIESMKPYFDKYGKLSDKGTKMVNGYVYNQVMNGLFMAEVMSPNIQIDNIAKRLKNAGSPVISVNKRLKFEPIFFKDPENDEASTDGGMFILREDADRWANAGKGVFDLNEGFKFLNYSIEKDNKNFKGQTVLLKGYTTILDSDFVEQNPKFKGLYDLMQKRREKYFKAHEQKFGEAPSMNFTDGLENSFPIAIPYSSEKTGMQKSGNMQNAPFLNELVDSDNVAKAEAFQDSLMYDNKGKYLGLSGYNFGPQQVMDKIVDEVTLPVQQMNSLLVHATTLGNLSEAEAIQSLISEMMIGNLDALTESLKSKDIETYKKVVKNEMNEEDMDQVQRFVINKYGILHPRAVEIVSNQLANTIKNKGNKLKVPGTYAHQKSSYGWQLPVDGEVKGSKDLNGYTQRSDGGLNRAEIVLPAHLGDNGQIRARKYYTLDSKAGEMASSVNDNKGYFDSSKTPKENDLIRLKNAAKSFAEANKTTVENVMKDGSVIGYYVPGETVIATRVPSNGPNFTGVFEVTGFTTGRGNQVQVPTSFSKIVGADLDGDALFIQHKSKNAKMNEVIDRMEKLWLSPDMAPFVQAPMETQKESLKLRAKVLNAYAPDNVKYTISENRLLENGQPYMESGTLAFSPSNRRKAYEDSMVAKRNIGTVFNLHRMANTLAAYEASIKEPLSVDGITYQQFNDGDAMTGKNNPTSTRNHKSALIANLILDNLKENAADTLNINEHTAPAFTILVNLNVPIEKVATMMNAPMVKEYVAIMNENNSAFHGYTPKSKILENLAGKKVKGDTGLVSYDKNSKGVIISDPKNKAFYSKGNQSHIINMIMDIDKVNADLQAVSKILGGHNGIETNPYLLEKQINEFTRIMSNQDSNVNVPQAMSENPDLKRYLKTAEATLEHTREVDLVYRPVMTSFLQGLASKQGQDLLTDNQIKKYTKSITRFLHSNISGLNQISKEELADIVDPNSPTGVFQELSDYMANIKMEGKLENNTLLSQGLNMKFEGKNPYISMNSNFFDESLNAQEVNKMNNEFMDLPSDLQYKLFHYDLTKNGWDSPLSMLPATDSFMNQYIVEKLNEDFKNKGQAKYSKKELRELEEILMLKDFNGVRNNIPTVELANMTPAKAKETIQKNPMFRKALENNQQFYFKSKDKNGKTNLLKFVGNTAEVYNKPINDANDKLLHLADYGIKNITRVNPRTNKQLDIDLVTIKSEGSGVTPIFKKKVETVGREARDQFWEYDASDYMDRSKFDAAMEFDKFQTETSKQQAYEIYLKEKETANSVHLQKIRSKDLSKLSFEQLMKMYADYGAKNAYAYAIVTTPIVKALAAKVSAQQSKLTGKQKGSTDIGAVQSWLMSNNIPSDHPEIQGMVRNMISMEKSFQNEKKKYIQKVNEATNALYKEKFEFTFDTYNPVQLLKRFYYSYIHNRKQLYEVLYGNIVETNDIDADGKTVQEFKLKDEKTIEALKKSGQLSNAEYDFYKTFRSITTELAPYSTDNGKKVRRDYIPHVGMGTFESFANKGLLGLLQTTKSENERLTEVKVYVNNPETGKTELVKFKEVDNIYAAVAANSKNNVNSIKEYVLLKAKAKKLLKQGKNEDGSELEVSEFEMDSVMSFGVMNRFNNSRSVKSTEMPSMDLNHALNTYVHSTLFVNGNQNFSGFKAIQGVVDGVLALNEEKGLKNAAKYVKLNWKDYYLNGKRQELLGKKGDKVVDLITKMNLFWQLGFKASYVLGNVAAGKYHNIKNGSTKEWLTGEKRFWGMDSGNGNPFDIVKRFKRTQKILKSLNFMDINVYDNVSMSSKGRLDNFLGDLALMPMTWSERWIQGVQMTGMLTQEEWNRFDDNGDYRIGAEPIDNGRLIMLENEVKKSQGKGYQPTDQRMVQQYSLGRMMMQFSRFIPTMVNDRFAKQDIDIYGNEHIGSLRMLYKTVSEVNSMNPKDYIEYRKKLQEESPELAKRLDSALKGLAISGLVGAYALETDNRFAEQSYWDMNYYADIDKFEFKIIPSSIRTIKSMTESITGN